MSDPTETPPETATCPLCRVTGRVTIDATTIDAEGAQTTAPREMPCPRCHATGHVPPELATL